VDAAQGFAGIEMGALLAVREFRNIELISYGQLSAKVVSEAR